MRVPHPQSARQEPRTAVGVPGPSWEVLHTCCFIPTCGQQGLAALPVGHSSWQVLGGPKCLAKLPSALFSLQATQAELRVLGVLLAV